MCSFSFYIVKLKIPIYNPFKKDLKLLKKIYVVLVNCLKTCIDHAL